MPLVGPGIYPPGPRDVTLLGAATRSPAFPSRHVPHAPIRSRVTETPSVTRRPSASRQRAEAEPERARLSRELSELLLELSIGAHRYAMYPPGHPSLAPIVENIIVHLGEIFAAGRSQLTVGVARRQLVIEGVATDAGHPVLGDLARRLHEHQISALSFARGTQSREIEGLLESLSTDPGREAEPVGLLPPEELPEWEHVRILPIGYDRLSLREDQGEGDRTDPAEELWLELARATLPSNGDGGENLAEDPEGLARAIRERTGDEEYDEVIVGYLRRLAEQVGDRDTGDAARVRARMSSLIGELDEDTLGRLVQMGATREERKAFVLNANQGLSVDAVVKILRAAATSEGQSISSSLTRLLTKLSVHANEEESARTRQADTALRENVERLIEEWELEDPNPDHYTSILDAMATASPLFDREEEEDGKLAGPERLVKMALEVDAWGMTVKKAVTDLLDREMSGTLLSLVEAADLDSGVAREIREYLASPGPLRRLLGGRDVDERGLNSLVDRMGEAAIEPLLSVLAESDSRSVRRKVFDSLGRLGPAVAERAAERLDDPRWFVVRNMLALLGRVERTPGDVDLMRFTRHPDARVRREAFTLAFREGGLRGRILAQALAEEDERLVRMALLELKDSIPETLVPTVVNRVLKASHPRDIRALAARTLRNADSTLARDALLRLAGGGRSLFGRVRVAERSPEVVAALEALAHGWKDDGEAGALLSAAGRSRDPEIRRAAGGAP